MSIWSFLREFFSPPDALVADLSGPTLIRVRGGVWIHQGLWVRNSKYQEKPHYRFYWGC